MAVVVVEQDVLEAEELIVEIGDCHQEEDRHQPPRDQQIFNDFDVLHVDPLRRANQPELRPPALLFSNFFASLNLLESDHRRPEMVDELNVGVLEEKEVMDEKLAAGLKWVRTVSRPEEDGGKMVRLTYELE